MYLKYAVKNDNKYTINLAAQDLRNRSTIEYLKHILTINGIADRITLEITESEALTDYASVASFIDDFKKMGCKIAIDDFGSGYSNFAYLAQFNVDYLKIDGSIIKRVLTDKKCPDHTGKHTGFCQKAEYKNHSRVCQ